MAVVTLEEMRSALKNTLGKKGMSPEEIEKLAKYITDFFGYGHEVIDNRLTSNDRDVFYMLEEEGLLTTSQEEVHLKKGKLWRIHYWKLKIDKIKKLAKKTETEVEEDESYSVYQKMDDDVWTRQGD